MKFSGLELAAILKFAKAMVLADGRIEKNEMAVLTGELGRFNVPPEMVEPLLKRGDEMEPVEALAVISKLDAERKKYVTAYLGTIMAADGDVDDKELALWSFISHLAGLSSMNAVEAVAIMASL